MAGCKCTQDWMAESIIHGGTIKIKTNNASGGKPCGLSFRMKNSSYMLKTFKLFLLKIYPHTTQNYEIYKAPMSVRHQRTPFKILMLRSWAHPPNPSKVLISITLFI